MYTEDEFVGQFQAVAMETIEAGQRFSITKDWYLSCLENNPMGLTVLESRACSDELTRRMDELYKLEGSASASIDSEPETEEDFMRVLEKMREIPKKMNEMQQWLLAEADRLGMKR